MARELELFDGTVLEFPDETTDDVMMSAGRRETTRLRDAQARRPLPMEVTPSSAGAGRGTMGAPQTAEDAQQRVPAPRRGGVRAEVRPYGAGDERIVAPAPAPTGGSVFDRAAARGDEIPEPPLTDEAMEWQSLSPAAQAQVQARQQYHARAGAAPEARPADAATNIGASVREMTANPVARGAVAGLAQLGTVGVGVARAAADAVGADDAAAFLKGAAGGAESLAGSVTQGLSGNDKLAATITSSIINSAPAVAMGAMGGPALRTLFAQSAAADYAETGNLAHAGIMGAAEALGERFGFPEQIRLLKGVVKGMPTDDVAKVLGALIAKEIPGEQATTAMQFLADKFGPGARNPNATFADYLKQAGETLEVTIGQTAVMGGGPAALTTARDQMQRADAATARSAMNPAERAAADAGFSMRPTERRKALNDRLDDLAAEHGLSKAVVDAAKKQAETKPLSEVPGFFKRYAAAVMRRLGRQDPDNAAAVFDQPPAQKVDSAVDNAQPQGSQSDAIEAPELVADGAGLSEPTARTPIDDGAHVAATSPENDLPEPTEGQQKAGNYKVGRARIAGMDISIENPEGSVRRGVDADGTPWENTMRAHYGYVRGSEAKDGDHVDVFIKPGTPEDYAGPVFVVDQIDPKTGKYDEAKAIIGAADQAEAEAIYRSNYAADWQGLGAITGMPMGAFKAWASSKEARKPLGNINAARTAGDGALGAADANRGDGSQLLRDERGALAVDARGADEPDLRGARADAVRPAGDTARDDALNADQPPANPVAESLAPGRSADGDGAVARAQGAGGRILARAGRTPNAAQPLELRANPDGSLTPFMEGYALLDQDSGNPIALPADVTDLAAKQAIRAAGAVSNRTNFYPPKADDRAAAPPQDARGERGGETGDTAAKAAAPDTRPPGATATTATARAADTKESTDGQERLQDGRRQETLTPVESQAAADRGGPAAAKSRLTPLEDERLQQDDFRTALEHASADIGWTQRGGQLIRSGVAEAGEGNGEGGRAGAVVGRTQWLGPELWAQKPEPIGEDDAKAAIRNALAGKPMTARQKRFVQYVLDREADRVMLDRENAAEAEAERAAIMAEAGIGEMGMQSLDDSDIPFDYRPEAPSGSTEGTTQGEDAGQAGGAEEAQPAQVRPPDGTGSEEARADEASQVAPTDADALRISFGDFAQQAEKLIALPGGSWVLTDGRDADYRNGEYNVAFSWGNGKWSMGDTHPTPKAAFDSALKTWTDRGGKPADFRPADKGLFASPGVQGTDLLSSPTAEGLAADAERARTAEATDRKEQKRLADKAKADAEVGEFTLTGSDSARDVAAAAGQGDLLGDPAPAPAPTPAPAAPVSGFEGFKAAMGKLYDGELSVEDYRAAYRAVRDGADAVRTELGKLTKDELTRTFGIMRDGKKDELVGIAYDSMVNRFALGKDYGPNSYGMTRGGYENYLRLKAEALDALVEGQTADDLATFAKEVAARREEMAAQRAARAQAIADPKTIPEFRAYLEHHMREGKTNREARMSLTPEQRALMDSLWAKETRGSRKDRTDEQRTTVRVAGQTVDGQIIATKHTKKGHDLFVVRLAERVSREDYDTLNAGAKKIGGYYSSYRGGGAIPGFQFTTREQAEAFVKLAGGDASDAKAAAQERRDAFADDRSQTAAQRLTEMADALEERADESLGRERKANTERRARMAASAEAEAQNQKALARTMRNIAGAIESGKAEFLDRVRQKVQVELLARAVRTARDDQLRAKYPSYSDFEKHKGSAPDAETADFAEFPSYTAYRSDLAGLGRQLLEVDGTKLLGQRIMKVADDVSDAYLKFAKEPGNLFRLSAFGVKRGDELKTAIFPDKATAERSLSRSGLAGKGIVFQEKRGVNRIILSPSEAIKRGIWTGDGDKRITLTEDFGAELVEKIGKAARRGAKVSVPWQFETAHDRLKALARMGIETPAEYRAALREFIGLREQAAEPDKVKQLERAMVGRKNDGFDFFPTPEGVADEIVDVAGIEPGMRVLEPSAGMGHIAERIRAAGVDPDVVEIGGDRRELLEAKGFNLVGRDFMDLQEGGYDRILMNPPFSDGRDIAHVRHAYELLKPGGRLVAIMGEGAFSQSFKRAEEFREWLEAVGGTEEKLPDGTFLDPSLPVSTGANARMVVIDKTEDNATVFSLGPQTPERVALKELADSDDLFALPRSRGLTVESIAADIDPGITVKAYPSEGMDRYELTMPDGTKAGLFVRQPSPYGPHSYGHDFDAQGEMMAAVTVRPGRNPQAVPESTDDVWIDVSKLKTGTRGHEVYAIAGAYAHNTGRMFIADPVGLSDEAMRRRSEAMLSLALRYGTSDFLAPHPRQVTGSKALRVPPLAWDYKDDLGNIERLIALNVQAVDNAFPAAKNLDFDADAGQFRNATTGEFVSRDAVGRRVDQLRSAGAGPAAAAAAGGRTVARAAVWRALLRGEGGGSEGGGRRDGLLARLARQGRAHRDALKGLFSLGPGDRTGLTITGVQSAVDELTKGWKNAPPIVVVQDMADPRVPATTRAQLRRMQGDGATGSPKGFFHNGTAYLVADELPSRDDVARVVFHEVLGHHGLRGFFGDAIDDVLRKMATAMPDAVRAKARSYGLLDDSGQYRSEGAKLLAAEEVLAELAETRPSSNWVQRAIAAIREWLRQNVPGLKLAMTEADVIAQFILPARRFVERGARAQGGQLATAFSLGQPPLAGVPTVPPPPAPPRQAPIPASGAPGPRSVWSMPEGSKLDNAIYKFQDKQVDLKRASDAIRAEARTIADKFDAYLQEELYHGRAASRVEDFAENELRPLIAEMKLRAVTQERLSKFLHARHAQEANELIAERGGLEDGGSGMLTADAKAFLAGLDPAERKRLDAVASKVDAMIAKTREVIVGYGLESRDTVDGWADMFRHYVPLQREEHDGEGMGIGQGFSIRGKEAKHRTGSTAAVSDILANVALQRERAIVRGEKNRVAVAMVGLALTNPNPDVWRVEQPPTEQVLNPTTQQIEQRQVPGYKSLPNVLVAKIKDGKGNVAERVVVFDDGNDRAMRMATALKNLDAEKLEGLIAASAKVTRYFASINTQYNPVFGFTNLVRDLQGAAINLASTPLAGRQAEIMGQAMKFLTEAAAAGFRMDGIKDQALWQELQREGGTTGYRDLYRTTEDRANAIKRELDPYYWHQNKLGLVLTAGGTVTAPAKVAQNLTAGLFDWLSDFNESLENVTRLAAYKVAIDQGLSKQRAASLAKNLTVNFNRGGAQKPQMGALYAFFNAAMQGTARIAQTLFEMKGGDVKTLHLTKTGKAIVAGGITLGVLQALALAAAGFEDDDIPDFVKERNWIIPLPGTNKKYLQIPMPLGWHVLPNFGRMATELALRGGKDPGKTGVAMLGVMLDAFNPLGGSGTVAQILSPTALDPMVALLENKDWTGRPIARKDWSAVEPGFKNAREAASAPGKWIAEAVNRISGGTEFVRGKVSPTPDQIDYIVGQVTGGVGRELSKASAMLEGARTGETVPTHKIPLLGRFYGDASQGHNQASRFYESLTRMREHQATIEGLAKQGRRDDLDAYLKANPEAAMAKVAEMAGKKLSELRAARRLLVDRGRRERVREVEKQITEYMRTFNARVDEAQKKGATSDQPKAPARATQELATTN